MGGYIDIVWSRACSRDIICISGSQIMVLKYADDL